ncbi:hypothetical protein HYFRA_00011168 [Hymenoscyphus fraxineus]|uniref:BTB domain-containing protein n=1 Tax=Hymenoscyphus fraxineus TaxID=746836 RepID=A0A9N9PK81_9HELO|nr:hypothetical protein HYFRA_00011168 [Hymenoscyphus fraxineus]
MSTKNAEVERPTMKADGEVSTTPDKSPIITLSLGPKSDPTCFYVHQDYLVKIPFFKAALRPGAFIEGEEKRINFEEEEDPRAFGRLIRYLYEDDCFPKLVAGPSENAKTFEVPLFVKEIAPPEKQEQYIHMAWYETKEDSGNQMERRLTSLVNCGVYIPTDETFQLFEMVLKTLCLSDRYGIGDLFQKCLTKLKYFPIRTKEVAFSRSSSWRTSPRVMRAKMRTSSCPAASIFIDTVLRHARPSKFSRTRMTFWYFKDYLH